MIIGRNLTARIVWIEINHPRSQQNEAHIKNSAIHAKTRRNKQNVYSSSEQRNIFLKKIFTSC